MAAQIKNWGLKLLGIWLLLQALNELFDLSFDSFHLITGIIALVAGILILIEK